MDQYTYTYDPLQTVYSFKPVFTGRSRNEWRIEVVFLLKSRLISIGAVYVFEISDFFENLKLIATNRNKHCINTFDTCLAMLRYIMYKVFVIRAPMSVLLEHHKLS